MDTRQWTGCSRRRGTRRRANTIPYPHPPRRSLWCHVVGRHLHRTAPKCISCYILRCTKLGGICVSIVPKVNYTYQCANVWLYVSLDCRIITNLAQIFRTFDYRLEKRIIWCNLRVEHTTQRLEVSRYFSLVGLGVRFLPRTDALQRSAPPWVAIAILCRSLHPSAAWYFRGGIVHERSILSVYKQNKKKCECWCDIYFAAKICKIKPQLVYLINRDILASHVEALSCSRAQSMKLK